MYFSFIFASETGSLVPFFSEYTAPLIEEVFSVAVNDPFVSLPTWTVRLMVSGEKVKPAFEALIR